MFEVGDMVKQKLNHLSGIVVEVGNSHPAYIKVLYFKSQTIVNYFYTSFDYFHKVS